MEQPEIENIIPDILSLVIGRRLAIKIKEIWEISFPDVGLRSFRIETLKHKISEYVKQLVTELQKEFPLNIVLRKGTEEHYLYLEPPFDGAY